MIAIRIYPFNPTYAFPSYDEENMDNRPNPSQEFSPGQVVFLKSDSSVRGAVVSVMSGTTEDRIEVFTVTGVQTFYASQLEIETERDDDLQYLTCNQFHAYLTALQIRYPGLSNLYSLNAARVDFVPYQYRPVLRFIRSDRPRLLIADSVGVGKPLKRD